MRPSEKHQKTLKWSFSLSMSKVKLYVSWDYMIGMTSKKYLRKKNSKKKTQKKVEEPKKL